MHGRVGMGARIAKIALVVLGCCVIVAALAAGATGLWLRGRAGHEFLRRQIVARTNELIDGTLTVQRLSGSLTSGVRLDGVRIVDPKGRLVARAASVTLRYHWWHLVSRKVDAVRRVDLERPDVRIFKRPDGRNDLVALRRPSRAPASAIRANLHSVRIHDGTVTWQPPSGPARTLSHLDASGGLRLGDETRVALHEARMVPAWDEKHRTLTVSGALRVARDGTMRAAPVTVQLGTSQATLSGQLGAAKAGRDQPLDVELHRATLSPDELSLLFPSLNPAGRIDLRARAQGTRERVAVNAVCDLPKGRAVARGNLGLSSAGSARVRISQMQVALEGIDVEALAANVPLLVSGNIDLRGEVARGNLTAQAVASGGSGKFRGIPFEALNARVRLVRRVAHIDGLALDVPGAHVTGHGEATLDGGMRMELDARIVDVSRLPNIGAWKESLLELAPPLANQVTLHFVVTKSPGRTAQVALTPYDATGTLTRQARRALQNRVLRELGRSLPNLRGVPGQ